jgi:replicative DNA helicase
LIRSWAQTHSTTSSLRRLKLKDENHGIEFIERALLATIINGSSADLFYTVHEDLKAEDFLSPFHRQTFRALEKAVIVQGLDIDKSLLLGSIKSPQIKMEFQELISCTAKIDNFKEYVKRIRKESRSRKVKSILINRVTQVQGDDFDPDKMVSDIGDELLGVIQTSSNETAQIGLIAPEILKDIRDGNTDAKVKFRIEGLNNMTHGLHPGYVIVAARPSVGKTEFAIDTAVYNAEKYGVKSLIYSLEMRKKDLSKRILSNLSDVRHFNIIQGKEKISPEEMKRLQEASDLMADLPVYIDDTPGISAAEIVARTKKFKLKHPDLGLVVIDYMQMIQGGKGYGGTREQEVTNISRLFKQLVNFIDAPIIVLSQLSRGVERREDKRPMLSDLRDSGSLEQDADLCLFLYSDNYYDETMKKETIWKTEIIVGKQRNGPVGTILAANCKDYQRFDDPSLLNGGQNHTFKQTKKEGQFYKD